MVLKFARKNGSWHWLRSNDSSTHCASDGGLFLGGPGTVRRMEITLEEFCQMKVKHTNLRLDGHQVCCSCVGMLKHLKENAVSLDLNKPFVVAHRTRTSCNPITLDSIKQAETKTIAAAKKLAKQIAEEEGLSATVFVPHTTYAQVAPPVKEIKHKSR